MAFRQWVSTTAEKPWQEQELLLTQPTPESEHVLELTGEEFQQMDGFGGCFNELGWTALSNLEAEQKAEVLDKLFQPDGDLRFNFCRFPIGASDYALEWYSLNEVDGDYAMEKFSIERDKGHLLPYIHEAQKRKPDLKLFASPWSPPTWMKSPRAYNHGTMRWEKSILEAYALYFVRFIQAYEGEGVPVSQLHVQNEPMSDQKFPSCIWTGEQFREFIADYLGPAFEQHGIDSEIWLGTLNGPETDGRFLHTGYDQYANLVLTDPKARQYVKGISYQWAGKYAIQQTAESWPELSYMQSENECGDGTNTWEYAHYIFNLFRHYLNNGVNSYIYWNMILEPEGRSTWGWKQNALVTIDPATKEVTYNPEFYVMKHFSHYVLPGARRLGTRGHWKGNTVAFRNPDGGTILIVSNNMAKPRTFTFKRGGETLNAELAPFSFHTFVV